MYIHPIAPETVAHGLPHADTVDFRSYLPNSPRTRNTAWSSQSRRQHDYRQQASCPGGDFRFADGNCIAGPMGRRSTCGFRPHPAYGAAERQRPRWLRRCHRGHRSQRQECVRNCAATPQSSCRRVQSHPRRRPHAHCCLHQRPADGQPAGQHAGRQTYPVGRGLNPRSRAAQVFAQAAAAPQQNILPFIKNAWNTLGRSMNDCSSISDPKFGAGATSVLYLPYGVTPPPAVAALTKCGVKVENLPRKITGLGTIPVDQLNAHGLLYLPNKYVVPGGRFNEMYGWDSYFIIIGLLEDGERDYARGIIENFFYEIENYGAVLNANRAYYLTRSQPPFLTSMIMAQYAADKKAGKDDKKWLARAYDYAVRDHDLWIKPPKLAGDTGLARYFDVGEGPVPDIADHPEYYAAIADWLLKHPDREST